VPVLSATTPNHIAVKLYPQFSGIAFEFGRAKPFLCTRPVNEISDQVCWDEANGILDREKK
jgi:hypothetical protein